MEQTEKSNALALKIKEQYVNSNDYISSVKQLDFYLKRNKTKSDQQTKKQFISFLSDNNLKQFFNSKSNQLFITPPTPEQLNEIEGKLANGTLKLPEISKNKKQDVILDQVIEIYKGYIEKFKNGEKVIFEQPWLKEQVVGLAKNANTGNAYQNGNAYLLSMLQEHQGLDLPFFINHGDIKDLKLTEQIPKTPIAIGTKLIEMYLNPDLNDKDANKWVSSKKFKELTEQQQEYYDKKKVIKQFSLYHHAQFENSLRDHKLYQKWIARFEETELLNKLKQCSNDKDKKLLFEPKINAAKNYLNASIKQMGVELKEHNAQCFYQPNSDTISMVNESNFIGDNASLAYVGVLAHEMAHSTGHESRLKRTLTGKFGSKNYGFEELIAESASLQTLKQFNLPSVLDEKSAAYIYGWLQSQKSSNGKDFLKIACQKGAEAKKIIGDAYDELKLEAENKFNLKDTIRTIKYLPESVSLTPELLVSCHMANQKILKITDKFIKEAPAEQSQENFEEKLNEHLKDEIGFNFGGLKRLRDIVYANRLPDFNNVKSNIEVAILESQSSQLAITDKNHQENKKNKVNFKYKF